MGRGAGVQQRIDPLKEARLEHRLDEVNTPSLTELAERTVRHLGQVTPCFVAGVLVVAEGQGQLVLLCCRPVDELFLRAVQQRLLTSYQLCVGLALAEPSIQVTVLGDSVGGPYEPPRSVLTMPLIARKRIVGIMGIASVFPDVFGSVDLCKMSSIAARAAALYDLPAD
jgi:GAF domain-containing protein